MFLSSSYVSIIYQVYSFIIGVGMSVELALYDNMDIADRVYLLSTLLHKKQGLEDISVNDETSTFAVKDDELEPYGRILNYFVTLMSRGREEDSNRIVAATAGELSESGTDLIVVASSRSVQIKKRTPVSDLS